MVRHICLIAVLAAPGLAMAQDQADLLVQRPASLAPEPQRRLADLQAVNRIAFERPPETSLRTTRAAPEPAEVELRVKPDWFEDEGFRVTPSKVAFKRRF